jgi:ribosomal protein S18 acetylase RimI-like enzyme
MSATSVRIRPAVPDDAAGIVDAIRGGFAPRLLDLSVYGCSGIERYVREQIRAEAAACDTTFDVAVADERVVGTIEMRALLDQLFLNYVAVTPEARSGRLGSRLLRAAIDRTVRPAHRLMALDVDEDNALALRWYDGLGFVAASTTEGFVLSLPAAARATPGGVTGAPQASVCHAAFGFSRLTVTTPNGSYDVGQLGTQWFRVTSRAALDDAELVAALRAVDPTRRVLALLPAGALAAGELGDAERVTATRRLTCEIDSLRNRLAERGG